MKPVTAVILAGLTWGAISLGQPGQAHSEGVKTHFKQYTIFTYDHKDYLCEPYKVKKNDWLYKIFRQKGEISASDFPRFLRIFRKLNPQLSNIDAIAPGNRIMIPLKEVDKATYVQKKEGIVEVPVLEFSLKLTKKEVDAYIHSHVVKSGDTVSALLGKEFLKKGGAVSEVGKKTFTSLNPEIKDINRIYAGSHVLIPEADILSQPWLETLLETGYRNIDSVRPSPPAKQKRVTSREQETPPRAILSPGDISRLKRYAQLIQGTVMNKGKVFFPGKDGEPAQILDLSKTPVLEAPSGQKTLILPNESKAETLDRDLVTAMKDYWKGIRLRQLNQAISGHPIQEKNPMELRPVSFDKLIEALLGVTPYTYGGKAQFPITLKHIEMNVSLGRITHDAKPDILVNTGNVYGKALDILMEQGYEILDLSNAGTVNQAVLLLFSKLGYETWKNPSFYTGGRVEDIQGVYVSKGSERTFITATTPQDNANTFLREEGIKLLKLDRNEGL
ncbi:MAG: LysM peptidoglycan-binding domain-containing protein [Desulfobacter sp.]|nr:MAG: LysM peptidoglycan-binding domain-containing protein [Desulfobacter sp.]